MAVNYYKKDKKTGKWVVDEALSASSKNTAASKASRAAAASGTDPIREWEDYVKNRAATLAAQDIPNAFTAAKVADAYTADNIYKMGGASALRSDRGLYGYRQLNQQIPQYMAGLQSGTPVGMTEEDELALKLATSDLYKYTQTQDKLLTARTGGLDSIDMTGMPKAQQQELQRGDTLARRDTVYEKLKANPDQEYYEHNYGEIFGDMSEREYLDNFTAYLRDQQRKNAPQAKHDALKAQSDAAIAEAKKIPGYEMLSKYIPEEEYLYPDMTYLEGVGTYTTQDGQDISASEYRNNSADAFLAAFVDAGSDEKKRRQIEFAIELLPELNNYNIEAIPYMSDDQRGAFFAMWNSGDRDGAKQLLKNLDEGLQKERVETETEQLQAELEGANWAEKALYSASTVPMNLYNELVGGTQMLAGIFNPEGLEGLHEYSAVYDAGRDTQTVRGEVGQDIADATENIRIPGTDINIPRMAYNALMSGADSVTNAFLLGAAGAWAPTIAMGAGAFGTEYRDSQNYWDALAAGAIEAGTEYLPFENMGRNAVNPFKKIGAGMLAEGLGESAAEIGNIVYDTVKYTKNSEAQQYIDELITMGYTPEDALGETVKKYGLEVLEAGLTGAISGGGSASTTAISDSIKNRTAGKNIAENGGEDLMLDLADNVPLDETSKDIVRRLREEMAERRKGDKAETETDDAASITAEDAEAEARESEMADRDSAEASELDKGDKTDEGIDDTADVTKEDAEAEVRETEMTARDSAERMDDSKGEKADEAIDDTADVTKEDAEAAARAEEMTERDRAERADEGKTTEEADAAAVTEEDAEAAVRTARDRGESADMTRGGRAEAEIDDTASVTEEDVRALTDAEAREWLNDEESWTESDEATETDAAAKDVAEEPSTINADAIASDYAETAAKRGEIEAREAERQQRRNERKAARDKGRKAVTKAEKGYLFRQILANLDKGAQQIVKDNFTRDMRREIEAVGYTGNAKEAAKVLSDFINGEVTPRALELLGSFESLRNIALSYMGKIEMRNNLYKQAGELSERAQKGYVKPETTTTEEDADKTEGLSEGDVDTEEGDLGYEEMEDDGEDSLSMPERDIGIEVSDTPESTYDGKAVTIESVKAIAEMRGEYEYRVTVKDADGNTYEVSAADVSIGSNDGKMAEIMSKAHEVKSDVNTAISMFNPETQDVSEYIAAWNAASEYGFDGRDIDVVKGDASINSVLTPEQIEAAYNSERDFRREMTGGGGRFSAYRMSRYASVPTGKVDTSAINMRNLKPNQKAAIRAMSSVAKAVGFNLRFVESVADAGGKYRTENGSWDPATLTLTLDIHAGSNKAADINYAMMHTAGHELTHFIRQFADGDLWNDFQEFVIGHLSKKGEAFDLDGAIKKHMDRGLSRNIALEEVIADASGEALMNITEADIQSIAETNPTLLNKIKNFFKKWISNLKKRIADAYAGTEAKTEEAKMMQDVVDEMSKRWNELFVNATKNKAVASETTIEGVEDADTSVETAMADALDGAVDTDGGPLYSLRTMREDRDEYREMLIRHGNMTSAEVKKLFDAIDALMDEVEKHRAILDFGENIDSDKRSFTPVKPNSDPLYQVSVDFSTLCRKRLLQQACQERLEAELGRAVTKAERVAIRDQLIKLQQEGKQIEVACALCYVESARLKSPAQIQKFMDNRQEVIRNYFARRNEDVKKQMAQAEADYRAANGIGDASLKNLPGNVRNKVRAAKNAPIANYRMSAEEQRTADKAMSMSVADFTTAESLWKLKTDDPVLFDIYTSFIRNATKSKGLEGDTPWKAGDSKAISDELIRKMNEENGLRSQSWSDFQTYHMLDYIGAIIELSTRNAKMQSYTKVPAFVKLMGETGVMINMSLIPEAKFDGTLKYDGVEGIVPEEAFALRKRYPETAGTICIGIDDDQIKMLLASDDIDYVIPYHRSGMDAATRKKMRIPTWKDYESQQGEKAFTKDAGKAPKFSEWFDYRTAVRETREANNTPEGKAARAAGDVMYGAKIAMQNAAQRYLNLCAERNLAPKFQKFVNDSGYWKLLIDRKMINNVTGEIIEQKAVKPVFDQDTMIEICRDEVSRFEQNNADFEAAVDAVVEAGRNGTLAKVAKSEKVQKQVKAHEDWMAVQAAIGAQEHAEDRTKLQANEATFYDDGKKYSERVTDEDTLDFLNNQKTVTTYKTMQLVDGKLYPPMAAVVAGKYEDASELGTWEATVEHPELIKWGDDGKAYFKLDKGQKRGSLDARYNPYMHSSNLVLNDQFTGAYARDNLVTVQCEVPVSELNSGYHAEHAKDPVGWHPWHAGPVAGTLRNVTGTERQVLLSRWIKPVRIVPDSEVAAMYKELLDGTGIVVPENVVPPGLKAELEKAGVPIASKEEAKKLNDALKKGKKRRSDVKYSIREADDGRKVVVVDDDILKGIYSGGKWTDDQKEKAREAAKAAISSAGPIHSEGIPFYINSKTKKEFPSSKYVWNTLGKTQDELADRFRISSETEDLVLATVGWKDDPLTKKRNDFVRFVKGRVYMEINGHKYEGTVVAGVNKKGKHVLYDLVDMNPATFKMKEEDISSTDQANAATDYSKMPSTGGIIAQDSGIGKTQMRDYSALSDRELLVQALETDLKPVEREHLEKYAGKIDDLNRQQQELETLHTHIAQMRAEGKTATNSSEMLTALDKAKKLREKIDRADAKLKEIESADMIREVVRRTREETRRKTAEQARARADERMRREVERIRGIGERKVKRVRDSYDTAKYKQRVLEDTRTLMKWLTNPTAKGYVPHFLAEPIAEFLEAIDYSSARSLKGGAATNADAKMIAALDSMRTAIANYSKMLDSGSLEERAEAFAGYLDIPEYFLESIDELVYDLKKDEFKDVHRKGIRELTGDIGAAMDRYSADEGGVVVAGTPLNRMTPAQLKRLSEIMVTIRTSIRKINSTYANARYSSSKALSGDTIEDMDEMTARADTNKTLASLNSAFNWKNMTPYNVFRRLGRGGRAIFEGLQDGWDKMAQNTRKVKEYAEKTFKGEEKKAWSSEISEVKLDSGDVIKMTTAQKMSLYCHTKREQSMGHLMGGGIRIADIDAKRGKTIVQADDYILTEGDIARIVGSLTARQKEVADALQAFMNDVCARWGNEISMKRFGFEQMTEKFYFPIETDANNRRSIDEAKDGSANMFRLLNMSSLKPLTPNANNAIVIKDIFNVFNDHASDMAKYNALALPILDFIKWYNFVEKTDVLDADGKPTGKHKTRSVQKSLERTYGKDAKSYLLSFIKDLNAEQDGGRDDSIINKWMSRAKAASVGANLRVYAQQITSLPRAAFVIDEKYLAIGIANIRKGNKLRDDVGILQWKDMGFYSTDFSRSMRSMISRDYSFLDKVRNWQMVPAGWGDQVVNSIICGAVAAEMKDKHPTLTVGTDAYKTMFNRRVREIIYRTQVVDSTMTRSQLMRSKGAMPMFTSFMSEPTLTVNMLNEAIQDALIRKRGGKLDENDFKPGTKAYRAAKAFLMAGVFNALIAAVVDAFRDDDEYEKYKEKYLDALKNNAIDNFNVFSMIPIIAEASDALEAMIKGNEYNPSTLSVQAIKSVVDSVNAIKEYTNGKRTLTNVIYNNLKAASYNSGIGMYNATRDLVAIYNTAIANGTTLPKLQSYTDNKDKAAMAMYEAAKKGDEELFARYAARAELHGITAEDLDGKYTKLISEDYVAGKISEDEADRMLKMYGGKTEYQAQTLISKLDYEAETGLEYSKIEANYVSGVIDKASAKKALITYGEKDAKKADAEILTWDYQKATGRKYGSIENEYIRGEISRSEIKRAMVKYGGKNDSDAEKAILHLDYQKKTGRPWSNLKSDYINKRYSASQVKKYLMTYDAKTEEEAQDTIEDYDFQVYTGKTTSAPKYWRLAYTYEIGGDYEAYADEIFARIMETGKSWKQARSSIASSIASYYKKDYLAIKGTAAGDRMLEEILDVYEAIGYDRAYERKYIAENWTED